MRSVIKLIFYIFPKFKFIILNYLYFCNLYCLYTVFLYLNQLLNYQNDLQISFNYFN